MKFKFVLLVGVHFFSSRAFCQVLSFEKFIEQAQTFDPILRAESEKKIAAEMSANTADLVTGLRAFSQVNYLDDGRPNANPTFQGSQTLAKVFSLGVQQQNSFGFKWSLSQNFQHTQIVNAAPTAIPVPIFYDSYPKIEASLNLWKNFAGGETLAQVDQIRQAAKIQKLQATLQLAQRQIEIEAIYDRVGIYKQNLFIVQDSLERAKKLLAWSESRVTRGLADPTDRYQAQAAVAARELELLSVQNQLDTASREFNKIRGLDGAQVAEDLIPRDFSLRTFETYKSEKRTRMDIQLQKHAFLAEEAQLRGQRESLKPTLDLSAQYLVQGRDPNFSQANENIFSEKKDSWAVSLNLSFPFDIGTAVGSRRGFAKAAEARFEQINGKNLEAQNSWDSMVALAKQLSNQFKILENLEKVQKLKADAEREKFSRGRSTSFQVLSFEQDYVNIRSQKLTMELNMRNLSSQIKLFEATENEEN